MEQRVFVDANVLYSRAIRDWLFLLRNAAGGMYTLHSSPDVLLEVGRTYRKHFPRATGAQVTRVLDQLRDNLDELVPDFDGTLEWEGEDEHDYHVHAATIASGADILLTSDRGFLDMSDDALPYSIYHPDDFFILIDDSLSAVAREVTQEQRRYYASRKQKADLHGRLKRAGCPRFADRVTAHLKAQSGVRPTDYLLPAHLRR